MIPQGGGRKRLYFLVFPRSWGGLTQTRVDFKPPNATDHTCEDMIKGLEDRAVRTSRTPLATIHFGGSLGSVRFCQNAKRRQILAVFLVQFSSVEHVQGVVGRSPEHTDTLPFTQTLRAVAVDCSSPCIKHRFHLQHCMSQASVDAYLQSQSTCDGVYLLPT